MKMFTMLVLFFVGLVSFTQAKTPDVSALTGCGTFSPNITIDGVITKAAQPTQRVPNATVTLLSSDAYSVCQQVGGGTNGHYTFQPVYAPNYYYIRVTATGYVTNEQYVYVYSSGWPYIFTYNVSMTAAP